jgi:RNA polymerase sigma-70 factor (ECF subfamily)
MQTEMTNSAQQDEAAVAAVRRGEAERYRELVERHERRVYAVAWSRLGDAALAEEATQEAFIRAYRRLWLLGDGAKFAAWVNTIARRVAINFGLRHRRELNKRKRWALENPENSTEENSADETDPLCTPETLRQTLAELPAAHRECLVLFYLENKSGAEAAVTLGLSETAFRVRLHRARAAMRERLEEKLEGSLAQLRPAKTLVPSIMAGVLASASAKAATAGGVGATILGALAKFTPFKWLSTFIPLVIIPLIMISPVMMWPLAKMKEQEAQRNYRDPKGFRASLHRQFDQSYLVFFMFIIGMVFVFVMMTTHLLGTKGFEDVFLIFGFFWLVEMGFAARQLEIKCSRVQIGVLFNTLMLSSVSLCIGLAWLPSDVLFPALMLSLLVSFFTKGSCGLQMDYNLFLRATQGLLPPTGLPVQKEPSIRFDRAALRAFGRFLGERQLASNFRWGTDGLILYLPAVKSPFATTWAAIFPSVRRNSYIALGWNGSVTARCGKKDAADLEALRSNSVSDPASLQDQVAMAVSQAWRNFREGKIAFAGRAIGQIPDTEIFVVPPIRTRSNRWGIIIACCLLIFFLIEHAPFFQLGLSDLEPVSATETEIRAFFDDIPPNPGPDRFDSPVLALSTCLVLPPTGLFSPEGLRAMRDDVAGGGGFDSLKQSDSRTQAIFNSPLLRRAVADGWISWSDLAMQPSEAAVFLRTNRFRMYSPDQWDNFLTRGESRSWVKQERFKVMRIQSDGVTELRLLQAVNCLDLINREKLIRQIASVQVLSATLAPGQPPIHLWRDVRGLFFTPGWPALQDTYFSLAALEILGGLGKIDREACIKGILRRHQGKGWFTSPNGGGFNEYHIDGSERDTIAAFESLRILGALDRVKDLEKWQFRPKHRDGDMDVTWQDVEAWVCRQRLERYLRERKENPQSPVHSLLDP